VAGVELRNPSIPLAQSSCLADLATHLEGMIIETRDPVVQQRIRRALADARRYLKGQKTELAAQYPALYERISPNDFDKGLAPEFKGLPTRLHRVGAAMIAILLDDNRSSEDRVRAAEWIGQTRYVLGILALLDNVWLTNSVAGNDLDSSTQYPCVTALAAFDSGASIDFAERIARSSTTSEVRKWKEAIKSEDALRGTITHLRGMLTEEQDAGKRANLQNAIQILRGDTPVWLWLTVLATILACLVAGRLRIQTLRKTRVL
jgi:hypothetical protein